MAELLSETIKGFPEPSYNDVDLTGLAAFTLNFLNENNIPTTFENIVVSLYKMFPTKFCLVGYPQFPDAARVGRTLLQLGPKYRNWARGSVQKGFVLTETGIDKVKKVSVILNSDRTHRDFATQKVKKEQAVPRTMNLSKEIEQLEASKLFQKWKTNHLAETKMIDLVNMLGAYAYTPTKALKERLKKLENISIQENRKDVQKFIDDIRLRFQQEMEDNY